MADEKKDNHSKQGEPSREFQNFQRLLKDTLAVPKEDLDKRRGEYEGAKRERRRRASE